MTSTFILPRPELEWLFRISLDVVDTPSLSSLKQRLPAIYWAIDSITIPGQSHALNGAHSANDGRLIHQVLMYESLVFSELVAVQHSTKIQLLYLQLLPANPSQFHVKKLPNITLFSILYPLLIKLTILKLNQVAKSSGISVVHTSLLNKSLQQLFEGLGYVKASQASDSGGDKSANNIKSTVKKYYLTRSLQ